ncbi:zinc-ribbon domain-containing protein [Stenotrophomonas mori]|uniref:Zinc ribbon domain-containing protein n=1 Tax=Stenotrophomonas mori TaxID=2871096 RepID=A0ABT0SKL6_9GAMM|nr:zinc-ribbon domain-containing protein [Stenotrophomonas mori]MCL7715875.1 zinc ribbon domain-containing protein [Stenotrophomonas mori]
MIIWGSKARQRTAGTGTFFCPECREDRPYARVKWSRYFTLYFIPLFPTETLSTHVRCTDCGGDFNDTVLDYSREQLLAAVTPWKCTGCGNTNPAPQNSCLGCGSGKAQPPELPA